MRTVALSTLWLLFAMPLHASGSQSAMLDYVNQTARAWFQTPEAQEAIAQSNHAHAGLSEEELIELDGVWRAEVGHVDTPVIDAMLDSPLSRALRKSVEEATDVRLLGGNRRTQHSIVSVAHHVCCKSGNSGCGRHDCP